MINLTDSHVSDLAIEILRCENPTERIKFIRNLQNTTVGAASLRRIVRDNVCNAACIVGDALWPGPQEIDFIYEAAWHDQWLDSLH